MQFYYIFDDYNSLIQVPHSQSVSGYNIYITLNTNTTPLTKNFKDQEEINIYCC